MAGPVHHLKNLPGQLIAALDGLIRIGVRSERDQLDAIIRFCQFPFQQFSGVGLCDQYAFEIETRRKSEIAMCRAGIAIDAAMLASPIDVD